MSGKEGLLLMKKEKGYDKPNANEKKKIFDFSEDYKSFIGSAKTERTFVKKSIEELEKEGFKKFSRDMDLKAGDKIYFENRGKGFNIIDFGPLCKLIKNVFHRNAKSDLIDHDLQFTCDRRVRSINNLHFSVAFRQSIFC